jgi:hypothetical protein
MIFFGKKPCEECRNKDEKIRDLEYRLQIAIQQLDAFPSNAGEMSNEQKLENVYFDRSLNWFSMELIEIERAIQDIYGRHGRTKDSIAAVNELQFIQQEIKRRKLQTETKLEENSEYGPNELVVETAGDLSDDLRFIAGNLERFQFLEEHPYQCYWLRSNPSGPSESSLYNLDRACSPLGTRLEELEFGDEWAKIFLTEPVFIDSEKRTRAFEMLCSSLARNISFHAGREKYHPNDAEVVELSKRFPKDISGKILEEIIKNSDVDFEAIVQEVITTSYKLERSHLENRLESKKPFVLPKFLKAVRVEFDEFGEAMQSDLFNDINDILEGIRVEGSYKGKLKIFHTSYDMVNIANSYMQNWLVEQDETVKMPPVDGLEFEHWVSQRLNERNWESYVTRGSGDQGIDVVATKYGVSIGIQCKRYSGPVGNKAVQEAFSGAKHMSLNKAAVLSNSNFTKSAKELAASTGVLLLSPEDIPILSELLGLQE